MCVRKKSIRSVRGWGLKQSPRSWGIFENFCVTLNCKLQKKLGEQDELVTPPIILLGGGAIAPLTPPVPAPL